MPYPKAVYWIALVLLIDIAGFWPTYFSRLEAAALPHHAHAIFMLLWMGLLITQHRLIHGKQRRLHRTLGRLSIVIVIGSAVSAVWVNLYFIARMEPPYPEGLLGVYWFGYFLATALVIQYLLALLNRRRVQYHARYMTTTALLFLLPGLGRAIHFYIEPWTGYVPDLLELNVVPIAVLVILIWRDYLGDKVIRPNVIVLALWLVNVVAYWLLPKTAFWREFSVATASWYAGA